MADSYDVVCLAFIRRYDQWPTVEHMLTKLKQLPSVEFITEVDVAKHLMSFHGESPGDAAEKAKSFIEHYAGYDFLLHEDAIATDDGAGCGDGSDAVQENATLVQKQEEEQAPARQQLTRRHQTPSPPKRQP